MSKQVYGLMQFTKCFLSGFCCISATKEPVKPISVLHSPLQSVACNSYMVLFYSFVILYALSHNNAWLCNTELPGGLDGFSSRFSAEGFLVLQYEKCTVRSY